MQGPTPPDFSAAWEEVGDDGDGPPGVVYDMFFPTRMEFPPRPMPEPDPSVLMETCVSKTFMSGVVGYGLGLGIGVLIGSYEHVAPPMPLPGQRMLPKVPLREQFGETWIKTGAKAKGWGQNFMVITAIFTGAECVFEKARGQHDIWNGSLAGCAAGATLAAKSGPQAACFGCVGFAVFSALIEKVTGGH